MCLKNNEKYGWVSKEPWKVWGLGLRMRGSGSERERERGWWWLITEIYFIVVLSSLIRLWCCERVLTWQCLCFRNGKLAFEYNSGRSTDDLVSFMRKWVFMVRSALNFWQYSGLVTPYFIYWCGHASCICVVRASKCRKLSLWKNFNNSHMKTPNSKQKKKKRKERAAHRRAVHQVHF